MQLQQLQQAVQQQSNPSTSNAIADTPTSERSLSSAMNPNNRNRSPAPAPTRPAGSTGRDSPFVRPLSASQHHNPEDFSLTSSATAARDETAFYQAESQMLTRENQMLRQRIRELGKINIISQILTLSVKHLLIARYSRTSSQRNPLRISKPSRKHSCGALEPRYTAAFISWYGFSHGLFFRSGGGQMIREACTTSSHKKED